MAAHTRGRPKKTVDDYCVLADVMGYEFVDDEIPKSTKVPVLWSCNTCGNKWKARYNNINTGHGCPRCAGAERKTKEDYDDLADSRGFHHVGNLPATTHTHTDWCCELGHVWSARYHDIDSGTGCPECYGTKPKTESQYAELAAENSITYIGPFPQATRFKTSWKCAQGHIFRMTFSHLSQKIGCPDCARLSNKSEEVCRQIMQDIFKVDFPSCRPEFLRREDTGRNMELDGYNPILGLAFEYQGAQHQKYIEFFYRGSHEAFEKRQAMDVEKREKCSKASVFLVTISAPLNHNTPDEIRATILEQTKNWTNPSKPTAL